MINTDRVNGFYARRHGIGPISTGFSTYQEPISSVIMLVYRPTKTNFLYLLKNVAQQPAHGLGYSTDESIFIYKETSYDTRSV